MENKKIKLAIIAGASHAVRYLKRNSKASEEDAIRDVMKNSKQILDKIDESD